VVAHRKPGFKAPIAISLPWNPPGIASKGESVIAENQNDVTIPLSAAGGAELKTWRIVANGTYTEPPPPVPAGATQAQRRRGRGGRLVVSSEFARLTVAPQFLTVKLEAASVEQGREVDLVVKVNKAVDFAGDAKMTLIGLPNRVMTSPVTINKNTTEAVFHVKTDAKTPPGETKSLFCQVLVMQNGEPILHNLGSGRLRIDAPLALKKPPTPALASRVKPGTIAIKTDPGKPLSRLQKLRLESKEKVKVGDGPR
jgi:hypothetical protein